MRILKLLLVFAFALSAGAIADEADPFLSVAEAKPYRERWQDCTASEIKRSLPGSRSVEAVVDEAFASCKGRETALGQVLRRRVGAASARRIVTDLRDYDRAVLIRIIERLRGK